MRSGVIIAGGRSTRFGDADKVVADLAGTPMIRRVADRIAGTVDELVVNCRPDQTTSIRTAMDGYEFTVSYAEDDEPDLGPVAGIRNGLRAADGEFAFAVACDMPFVEPPLIEYLFERVQGHEAAVPRTEEGWYQTTQAVYHTEAMAAACDAALERDDRRVVAPLEDLDSVTVTEAELADVASLESFENLNTREEFEAAAERLGDEG